MKFLLLLLVFLLNSCGGSLVGKRAEGSEVPRDHGVRFLVPWDGEDGMSLFARIDGTDHLIQQGVRNFTMLPAREFTGWGIPAEAAVAATFLEAIDSKLDYQGVYIIREEGGPKIYRGFYVPGLGNYVEWKSVPLLFD